MRYIRNMQGYGAQPARRRLARRRQRSPSSSSSTTRRAARTTSCMATPPPRPSSPRSSAPRPGRASATGTWSRSTNTAPAPASGGCTGCSPAASSRSPIYGVATALAALARPGRRDAGGRLGDRQPRPEVDRLQGRLAARPRRADMAAGDPLHTEVTGERPLGWYTGRCSVNTVDLASEEGGFALRLRHLRRRPALLARARRPPAADHPLHARRQRHALRHPAGLQLRRAVLQLTSRTASTPSTPKARPARAKMMSIGLHCRLVGRPGRAAGARALHRLRPGARQGLVPAPHRHRAPLGRAPPVRRRQAPRPSEMPLDDFVARFGGVFEHSPWIAERAHALELGPAHDTATGAPFGAGASLPRRLGRGAARRAARPTPTSPASSPRPSG